MPAVLQETDRKIQLLDYSAPAAPALSAVDTDCSDLLQKEVAAVAAEALTSFAAGLETVIAFVAADYYLHPNNTNPLPVNFALNFH